MPATLVLAGVEIDIETGDDLALRILDLVVMRVPVPHLDIGTLADGDTKQALGNREHAGEHLRRREIRAQFFL